MSRLLPMQSVKGDTAESTQALRLLLILGEVETQARIFSDALDDAMSAADREDATLTWRHLKGAMFAAIVVNRLVMQEERPAKPWGWLQPKTLGREAADNARAWRVGRLNMTRRRFSSCASRFLPSSMRAAE